MKTDALRNIPRRNFLKLAGAAGVCGFSETGFAATAGRVCLLIDPENSITSSVPSMTAVARLGAALDAR
ncbi:MAG: twin-arginine translocation signal domain-containing protein, partial [Terracidiphilus sp.]